MGQTSHWPKRAAWNRKTHKRRRFSGEPLYDAICDDCGAKDHFGGIDELAEWTCSEFKPTKANDMAVQNDTPVAEVRSPVDEGAIQAQLDRIEKVVSLIELRCDARCGKRESQYGELGLAKNEDWYRYRDLLVRFFMYEGML